MPEDECQSKRQKVGHNWSYHKEQQCHAVASDYCLNSALAAFRSIEYFYTETTEFDWRANSFPVQTFPTVSIFISIPKETRAQFIEFSREGTQMINCNGSDHSVNQNQPGRSIHQLSLPDFQMTSDLIQNGLQLHPLWLSKTQRKP
jgi:hypothetical protein